MRIRPHCKKCDGNHWYFVACQDAEAENAREDAKLQAEKAKATVTRIYRNPQEREFKPVVLRNYVQTAPNVFRLRKHTAPRDAA